MIEVAISQYSLEFSSQILSIEQKYISSFRFLQKLPLSKHILLVINKFIHSLQHYFIFLAMEVKHMLDHILPFIYYSLWLATQNHIFTLPSEIKHKSLLTKMKFSQQNFEIDAAYSFFLLLIFETYQFLWGKHHVPFLNNAVTTCQTNMKPSVFFFR